MPRDSLARLARAWLLTTVVDGLFSTALNVFAYHSTIAQLWQRVASTLLGPAALTGGTRTMLIGLLMHAGVALVWSTVFFGLMTSWPWLRRAVARPSGALEVAVVYGPVVWLVMSLVVIPALTGRPPAINGRWWVQLLGHIPFVALPIVAQWSRWPARRGAVSAAMSAA
ncbi:MAG: hypothetical protein JWM41_1740 [Gemmatimonadetes bacterium]|nr:hypothetical protein [Gemmatimonadota bacterium]